VTLWVHYNDLADRVINDLKSICPDPGLTVDAEHWFESTPQSRGNGQVRYNPTMSSVGCNIIATLVNSTCWVGIRGERPQFSADITGQDTLLVIAGEAVSDIYPGTKTVDVIYDATDCDGRGGWVYNQAGAQISYPKVVSLFHELSHAYHLALGSLNTSDPEAQAVADENAFRTSINLPSRRDHQGACNP
jgi:hypothetical protein